MTTKTAFAAFLTLLFLSGAAFGQIGGLETGFSPGPILNGDVVGEVRTIRVLSDNSTIIGGSFTSVNGIARGNIAKLTSAGALDPNFATGAGADGIVHAVAVQSDGKIVIGGEFQHVNGVVRNRIARLNADGSLDTTFAPSSGANGPIYALAITGTFIIAAGDFTTFNNMTRGRIARLSTTGALTSLFSGAGANGAIRCLALDLTGSVLYAGGAFTTWDGVARSRLVRLYGGFSAPNFPVTLDNSFNTGSGPDGVVQSLAFTANSSSANLLAGGEFQTVDGLPRARLAMFTSSGGPSLMRAVASFDEPVRALAAAGNNLYIGGDFSQVSEYGRGHFVRLKPVSAGGSDLRYEIDVTYHAGSGTDGPVLALAAQADGKLVLGGAFSSIAGTATACVGRLYGDAGSSLPGKPINVAVTAVDAANLYVTWSGAEDVSSYKIERSPDGIDHWTQVGTGFSPFTDPGLAANTTYFYRIKASNSNGDSAASSVVSATTLAIPWNGAGVLDAASATFAGTNGYVYALAVQPDGKIVLGGSFTMVHGMTCNRIARLNPDWTVDSSFDPGAGPGGVIYSLALDGDRIVIAGSFSSVAGQRRNSIARLLPSGALDTSFDPDGGPGGGYLSSVAVHSDHSVIVVGSFDIFDGQAHANVARLHPDGSVDAAFHVDTGSSVNLVDVQGDGAALITGSFNAVNGIDRYGFARVKADGSYDAVFNAGSGIGFLSRIDAVAALNNGKVLIAGFFSSVSGVARVGIARLNEDGTVDTGFDAHLPSTFTGIRCVGQQPDGKVVIGGSFTELGGSPRFRVARLNVDGSLDDTFQPGLGADADVRAVGIGADTGIILAGEFTKVGGVAQRGIARLRGDGYPAEAPGTPAGLAAQALSKQSLRVSWVDQSTESGWKLERSLDGAGGWVEIATLPWDVTDFEDSGLLAGATYFYRLRASNGAGLSGYSAVANGTTYTLYQQWKADHAFAMGDSDDADGDGDGIGLLLEYALGSDPAVNTVSDLPVGQILGDVVALSYRRMHPELTYAVEVSTDLHTWTTDGVSQGTGPFPIAFTFLDGAPQKFLRLRVTQQQ